MVNVREKMDAWLISEQGRSACRRIAKGIHAKLMRGGPFSLSLPGAGAQANEISADDIENELVVFVLHKCAAFQKKIETATPADRPMHLAQFEQFMNPHRLSLSFHRHILSAMRSSPRSDPFRYLYKRASDVLRASDRFVTGSQPRSYTRFALREHAAVVSGTALQPEMDGIHFPADYAAERTFWQVLRRANILALAEHVCRQGVALRDDRPAWIHLADFVNWVLNHIDTPPGDPKKLSRLDDAPANPGMHCGRTVPGEGVFDAKQVGEWARMAVPLLTGKQQTAYFLKHGLNLTLDDTAGRMGMKHASNVSYHLNGANRALKRFLGDKPWLSPADADFSPDAFDLFHRTLIAELKKTCSQPL